MRVIEIILVVIAVLGAIFWLFHWPFASEMLISGIASLALFYAVCSFAILNGFGFRGAIKRTSYQNIPAIRIVGAVFVGIGLMIALEGILFRIMYWPMGQNMLSMGLLALLVPTIIVVVKLVKTDIPFYVRAIKRMGIVVGIGLMLTITSDYKLLSFQYPNHPDYVEAFLKAQETNEPADWKIVEEKKKKMFYYDE